LKRQIVISNSLLPLRLSIQRGLYKCFKLLPCVIFLIISYWHFVSADIFAQETTYSKADSVTIKKPLIDTIGDFAKPISDTIFYQVFDEKPGESKDTTKVKAFDLETKVVYNSFEKIHFDLRNRKVFLFYNAAITYGDIKLKANYIEIDFIKKQVYATGLPDSLGVIQGKPVFSDGPQEFQADEITYNFDTRKGVIKHVMTQEGEGFIHGEKIKRLKDERINVSSGQYTTCNLPHPHFEFRYGKAQLIPNKMIVSGPAYLAIEGVALPIAIPFGLFPNKSGQRSGIIIPRWGESQNRGFYFERLGYYWGINDYMDFTITGDIFTGGSWAINPMYRYKKRYKYSGNFSFNYAKNFTGDRDSPDRNEATDFSLIWSHNQDPKARPNSRFTANVNIYSRSFNQFNLSATDAYLSNTFQSSVSYQTNFNNAFFINLNALHQQNTIDGSVIVNLPTLSMNTKQFYPFRRKEQIGQLKWYENITMKYSSSLENRIQTYDSLLFKPGWEKYFKNGMQHKIPISSSVKVLKFFNFNNSAEYTERWYPYSIHRTWNPYDTIFGVNDTIYGRLTTDTLRSFVAARDFSYSASLNTRLYGMYQFSKGPVVALRHVLTPTISFNLRPDFGSKFWGYWDEVQVNDDGDMRRYSHFEGLLYGGPPDGKSGNLSFSLTNNLEAKVRSRADTLNGTKKIVLIDNFTASMAYDLAKDSLNLSPLRLSGRTTLFKQLNITYSSSWEPYATDENGKTINQLEWNINKKPFRMSNTTWNFGINYRISSSDFGKKSGKAGEKSQVAVTEEPRPNEIIYQREVDDPHLYPDALINWDQPWSLNISYNLMFSNNPRFIKLYGWENNRNRVMTVGLTGDLSLTPKWKIGFRTGYDFTSKQMSYTSIDFYRDLHCWEMRFNWTPLGFRKSWSFGINVKASILKDLKYDKKKDFRDGFR